MALQMRRSPHRFRAVIKHELGHIVNKDVWRTYFTQALWSTVLLALSVFIAFFSLRFLAALWRNLTAVIDGTDPNWFDFFRFRLPLNLWFTLQTLGLLALFHSIRISVLRAREVYADWRAVLQGGESGMREILSQQVEKPIGWWQRIFAVHPHPSRRLALLDNPDSLFKLSADLPLYVGVMLGTAFNGIMMTGLELSGAFTFGLGLFMDVVLVGPVIAGETQVPVFILSMMLLVLVIGMIALIVVLPVGLMYIGAQALSLQTQRSLIVGLRDKAQTGCASLLRLGPSAVTLAVGIQLGLFLAPASITTPVTDIILHEGSMLPALLIPIESMLWLLAFTLSIWVWLAFARLLATVGLGAHTGKEPPRRKMRLMTLALGLLLSMISVPAMMAQMWIYRNFGGLASVGAWDFRGILLATIVVVVLGVVFAIAVWMALEAWAKLSQRRCPQCSHKVSQRIVIGKVCPNCRTELAPWIYVEASA
jgi:Zn-dependent protease with chaperone function